MSFQNSYDDSTQYASNNEETVFATVSAVPVHEEDVAISAHAPQIGETLLGLYRISSYPYTGGMGSVVRVHHTTWNVDLAMKQPHFQSFDSVKRELFIRECEAWINLGLHPNIVACYYVRNIDGIPSIFAEWMDDGSLKEKIASADLYQGSTNEALCRILDILIQSAQGIAFAHSNGLVHQDIKPANILCRKDGAIKIADFGLANVKKLIIGSSSSKTGETTLAANGGYTLQYCSPEQLKGQPVSVRTDIWSWAVTALEMFVGACKWSNGPIAGFAFESYLEQAIIPIPNSLKMLLSSCFQEDAEKRPHDFVSIINILLNIYQENAGQPYLRTTPNLSPLTADFLNNKALSYIDLGKLTEAEEAWEQALSISPHHADSLFNYSLFQWRNGTLTDLYVIEKFRKLYEQNKFDYLLPYAELLCESGRYATASRLCTSNTTPSVKKLIDFCGDRLDDFSTIQEIKITSNENANIHDSGIQVDPKDQSILACEITEYGNTFHRMSKNDNHFHIEKEIVYDTPAERIIHFLFTYDGKYIWVTRVNQVIDVLDAKTYQFIKRLCSPDSSLVPSKYTIMYALTNEIKDLFAFVGITDDLKLLKMIWNVPSEQIIHLTETKSLDCFFAGANSIYLGDTIIHFDENDRTHQPVQESVNKALSNTRKPANYALANYVFPVEDSLLYVYEGLSQQCLQTFDTQLPIMNPLAIFSDAQQILIHGRNIIRKASFSRDRYRCDWHISKIISVSDTEHYKKQFKVLYDTANAYYQAGDLFQALQYIDKAALIPGYGKDPSLMKLNREVGKYCRITGLRNFDFSTSYPIAAKNISIDSSKSNYNAFDRKNRITICSEGILDLLSGNVYSLPQYKTKYEQRGDIVVVNWWNHSLLLWKQKTSLEVYLRSKEKTFSSLLLLIDDGMRTEYNLSKNTCTSSNIKEDKEKVCFKQTDEDEECLIVVQKNGMISKWNLNEANNVSYINSNVNEYIYDCTLSNDGNFLALLLHNQIKIWNIDKQCCCSELDLCYENNESLFLPGHNVDRILFLENNDLLTCSRNGQLIVWDILRKVPKNIVKVIFASEASFSQIHSCALSLNQKFLLVCGDQFISLVDMEKGIETNYPFDDKLYECLFTAEKSTIFLRGYSDKHWGTINWQYEFPGWADWDDRALPVLNRFLKEHTNPSEAEIDDLILLLQNKDLGWLRREGIKSKLQELQRQLMPSQKEPTSSNVSINDFRSKQEEERKAALRQLYRKQGRCDQCGGKFKGLFKKICSVCGAPKNY